MERIRIGAGAGFAGDRIEPALELIAGGRLDVLVLECLAERTVANAQLDRLRHPERGYDPLLQERMTRLLPEAQARGVRIVTNMGAANPAGAAQEVCRIAEGLGLRGLTVAAVLGDDVLAALDGGVTLQETGASLASLGGSIVSANAYLGAAPIVEALERGAQVIVTGRVADPSLFVGPIAWRLGWSLQDWDRMGQATLAGHLLECAGQLSGGYFADPGHKDVPDLARLGFPLVEIGADGTLTIEKIAGTGGEISPRTCKEQLLYEVFDPAAYETPDVTADFSAVQIEPAGSGRVRVRGGAGRAPPESLKVSVGFRDGFLGEGQISYAGPGALARARLAQQVVEDRLRLTGVPIMEQRAELIGLTALCGTGFGARAAQPAAEPAEVRLRIVARTPCAESAERIGREVEALYTNGPAGGGGVWRSAAETIGILSTTIPRSRVRPRVTLYRSRA